MLDVNMINDAITKKAQLDAEAERLAMDKELAARKALKAEIKKMAPRIKATIDVCNMLIDNGFTLRRYDSSYGKNNRSNGGFYAEGFHHRLGFFGNNYTLGDSKSRAVKLAILQGGACGPWDFFALVDGTVYEYNSDRHTNPTREPNSAMLTRFIKEFNEFEAEFEQYVNKVIKGYDQID